MQEGVFICVYLCSSAGKKGFGRRMDADYE
jgi:hypothetical protein